MVSNQKMPYIELQTDYDGDFRVTILSKKGEVLFNQNIRSNNKRIVLKGFTLKQHTVTLSPIQFKL